MFCSNCGSKNEDGSAFCLQCGSKLDAAQNPAADSAKSAVAQPAPAAAATAPAQPTQTAAPAAATTPAQPAQPATPAQQPVQPHQPATQYNPQATGAIPPVDQVPVPEGCIGAAWRDITSSKGWFGRSLLLGLLNALPGINFAVTGYTEQWGVDVAKGTRDVMPKISFNNRQVISGIFEFVAWLIYGLILTGATIVTTAIFSLVPVLPFLVSIAWFVFGLFYHGYISLASMRSALKMDFGSSYQTSIIYNSYKKKRGTLLGAYLVPSLVCKAITVILVIICIAIFAACMVPLGMNIFNSVTSLATPTSDITKMLGDVGSIISSVISFISTLMGFLGLMILIVYVAAMLLGGFEKLWRYRAVGHWIARFAPEWVTEEDKNMKYLRI